MSISDSLSFAPLTGDPQQFPKSTVVPETSKSDHPQTHRSGSKRCYPVPIKTRLSFVLRTGTIPLLDVQNLFFFQFVVPPEQRELCVVDDLSHADQRSTHKGYLSRPVTRLLFPQTLGTPTIKSSRLVPLKSGHLAQ